MDILSHIPSGEKRKISSQDLAERCGCKTVRQLQERIERLRRGGEIIASSCQSGGGYFVPISTDELRAYVRTCENRAKNTFASLGAARKQLQRLEREIADQTKLAEMGE